MLTLSCVTRSVLIIPLDSQKPRLAPGSLDSPPSLPATALASFYFLARCVVIMLLEGV